MVETMVWVRQSRSISIEDRHDWCELSFFSSHHCCLSPSFYVERKWWVLVKMSAKAKNYENQLLNHKLIEDYYVYQRGGKGGWWGSSIA